MNKYYSLIILIFIFGCSNKVKQIPFNKDKWDAYAGFDNPSREQMIEDIINNKLDDCSSFNDVYSLLGPQKLKTKNNQLSCKYEVAEDYSSDIDPDGGMDLIISFNLDSTLIEYHTNNWGTRK